MPLNHKSEQRHSNAMTDVIGICDEMAHARASIQEIVREHIALPQSIDWSNLIEDRKCRRS